MLKGSPAHVSALSSPATRTGIRPVPHSHRPGGGRHHGHGFRCHSAIGLRFLSILFPPRGSASLDRPTGPERPDLDWVSTFHAHEMRPERTPSMPRDRRCLHNWPVASSRRSSLELQLTRRHQGFIHIPRPAFPLPGRSSGRNGGPGLLPFASHSQRASPIDARQGGDRS
jgi:hypothetical protein